MRAAATIVGALALILGACEGDPPSGDPFNGSQFGDGEARADLASLCTEFCAQKETCDGAADAACLDDCVEHDVAWEFSAEPPNEDPVPADCAVDYEITIDCLSVAMCTEGQSCDSALDDYVSCKLELTSE